MVLDLRPLCACQEESNLNVLVKYQTLGENMQR